MLCGLFRHHVLDDADKSQGKATTNTTAGNLCHDAGDIKPTGCSATANKRAQNLAADSAAHNPCDRVAQRSKRKVFHDAACDIAADCARDELNDQLFQNNSLLGGPESGLACAGSIAAQREPQTV